jgi:Zn-dependent protease with chaperone function
MAPLQLIILLLLVRIPGLTEAAASQHWLTRLPGGTPTVFASFLLTHLALVLFVAAQARTARRLMHRPSTSSTLLMTRMDHLLSWSRWSTIALTALHLYAFGAAGNLDTLLAHTHILKRIPLLPETLLLAPALLSWICFWASYYTVEAAQRERQLPARLAQQLPAHEMPPMSTYLSMQIRHQYYLLLPVAAATLLERLGEALQPRYPTALAIATPLALFLLFLLIPWLITRIWSTIPLRGPLRSRLDSMARRHRLRFRNILLWKTHNAVTNAAILGFLPFARYFLMTDALLESLTDRQIEAVFAHEVGHGVHKHIWWYLGSMFAVLMLAGAAMDLTGAYLGPHHPWATSDALQGILAITIAGGFLLFVFPKISHRFEHQADWFAARQMAEEVAKHPISEPVTAAALTVEVPADGVEDVVPYFPPQSATPLTLDQYLAGNYPTHTPTAAEPAPPRPPLAALPEAPAVIGAEIFVSALDTIIEIAHKTRTKAGWMHPSVNDRIRLIRNLAVNRPAADRFNRDMFWTRILIAAAFALGLTLTLWAQRLPSPTETPAQLNQVTQLNAAVLTP